MRALSTPLSIALLALVSAGCSRATMEADDTATAPEAPLSGDQCAETPDCPAGLNCVGGACLKFCNLDADCGAEHCQLFPGGTLGYCLVADGPAPAAPNPPGEGSDTPTPAAPDETPNAPGPADPDAPVDDGAPPDPAEPPADGPADKPEPPADEAPPDAPPDPPPPDTETPPAPPADCRYPAAGDVIAVGRTMPHYRWATARDGQGNIVDFDLERFHCDPAWAQYSVAAFIVGAGWCSACVDYDRALAPIGQSFESAGGLFVFIEVEDVNYNPADSAVAAQIVQHAYGNGPGLRLGDADTQPSPMAIGQSSIVGSYPSAFVVRRSDMQVIVDQASSNFTLDYVQIARDAANGPGPAPGPAPGGDCVEEPGEPDDDAGQAVPLVDGELTGGICNGAADFYSIRAPGAWHVDLIFAYADADLDLYLWDTARQGVAVGPDGNPLGSDSADDNESFDGFGPATLQIVGWEGARAPYRLRFSSP